MFGVAQTELTRALAPTFGWAIVYDDEPTSSTASNTE
jgi:hypothetical protein